MVVDTRLGALRPDDALRKSDLDGCTKHHNWLYNIFGVFGDTRLCAGIIAHESRTRFGVYFSGLRLG